ncbi:hypothetical protein, partial [Curtobacterium sp. 260]
EISTDALTAMRQSRADAQTAQDAQVARAQDITRAAERVHFTPDSSNGSTAGSPDQPAAF